MHTSYTGRKCPGLQQRGCWVLGSGPEDMLTATCCVWLSQGPTAASVEWQVLPWPVPQKLLLYRPYTLVPNVGDKSFSSLSQFSGCLQA